MRLAAAEHDPRTPDVDPDELKRLVKEVRRGNIDAYRVIYESYGRRILNYVYRMIGHRDDAEDIMQDTFVMAFKKIKTLQDTSRFQSWLYRIALNNVYQRFRSKRMQWEPIDAIDESPAGDLAELTAPEKNPEEAALGAELEGVIRKAIRDLPDKYRHVFVLSALDRLDYQTIANILGRSLASTKSDIHRARVEVRDKVKRYLGSPYELSQV